MSSKQEFTCGTCGKKIMRYPSRAKIWEMNYCSNECRYATRRADTWKPVNFISDEQALDDLRQLHRELGRYVTAKDVNIKWPHRSILYARRFGSVKDAVALLGIEYPKEVPIRVKRDYRPINPINESRADRANQILGLVFSGITRTLRELKTTIGEIDKKIRRSNYRKKYNKTNKSRPTYTNDQLLSELTRVASFLGHTPTDMEFRKYGNCSTAPYWRRFGSWAKACELVGLEPHTTFEGGLHMVKPYRYTRAWDKKVIRLVGTYELRFAKKADELEWKWLCQNEYKPIIYVKNGLSHKYIPDFYLPDFDIYIETKGWYMEKDKLKMGMVFDQNPSLSIKIVGQQELIDFERSGNLPT